MELELDGEPRNRQQPSREESPHATRWRVGEQEIVADLDPVSGVVVMRVGDRTVGELPSHGGSHRFTLAAGSGYRGGAQVEARIHRDARTGMSTLWVDGVEVAPTSRPTARAPSPPVIAPRSAPTIEPFVPHASSGTTQWGRGILLMLLVLFFAIPTILYLRERPKAAARELEAKTAVCLRRADVEAEAARARLGDDPKVDDQRRLARISCKQHEQECKRDPRGLLCLMDPK